MKPWQLLGETHAPDGALLALARRDREYLILADGKTLMSSRMHGSEEALATFACARARTLEEPCVLVGGLGMGFTLRATLDLLPPAAAVIVSELMPAVVEWNRGPLGPLAEEPLHDGRVASRRMMSPSRCARMPDGSTRCCWTWTTVRPRSRHRATQRCTTIRHGGGGAALRSDGVLAVWSAWEDRKFEQRCAMRDSRSSASRARPAEQWRAAPHDLLGTTRRRMSRPSRVHFVYLLRCGDGTLYCGSAKILLRAQRCTIVGAAPVHPRAAAGHARICRNAGVDRRCPPA